MNETEAGRSWTPLSAIERRVLGVLIEKQKTTPEYYPMTINALVTGCNQKSNRDPVTALEAEEIEDTLQDLRKKGVTVMVDTGGRTLRWKHQAYDWLGLKGRPAEMAVLAELMLRGPQTEGELRQRASRMDEIPDLTVLQTILAYLNELGLIHFLSPPGQKRGVVVAHGLYPPDDLSRLRETIGNASIEAAEPRSSSSTPVHELRAEISQLREEIAQLRVLISDLENEVSELKRSLGV